MCPNCHSQTPTFGVKNVKGESYKKMIAGGLKGAATQKEKFKHLILYILSQVGAKYNVGKVVLYKLLYFSEFDFYELHGEHISGYPFIKLPIAINRHLWKCGIFLK